jgi:hypothetical protein
MGRRTISHFFARVSWLVWLVGLVACTAVTEATVTPTDRMVTEEGTAAATPHSPTDSSWYNIGNPTLTDLWVDPINGDDANSGASRNEALATLTAAWERIPPGVPLNTTGYHLHLVAGNYDPAIVPVYWESRYGTFPFPILIESADGPGAAHLPALNIYDTRYLYLLGLHISAGGGDVFHCEQCDHLLLRQVTVLGADPGTFNVQETVKINQSSHVYLELSDFSGAWDNAIDFVAVQYGHIRGNFIHNAGDWCHYVKGGSAYFRVEGNTYFDCGTGGFTTGQGTGFEFMTSPWLHYEAYDIKFVNNVLHDIEGACMGVNGGYNILLAYNTCYRTGERSHLLEVVFGLRGCDGNTAQCNTHLAAGGWGTAVTGGEEPIPDRNVYIYNNIFYNPADYQSQWQHLAIYGPRPTSPGSNIPNPAQTDTNLHIRGNVIWNGPANHPLGIEGSDQGCQPTNPTCNQTQLLAENHINTFEPELTDPANGDFQVPENSNLLTATTFAAADFTWTNLPALPVVPPGDPDNSVPVDFRGRVRLHTSPPGAFGEPWLVSTLVYLALLSRWGE